MKHFVERTCTVVRERAKEADQSTDSPLPDKPESRPLESFRNEPAYVLLGSPGSGKTEAFKHEARNEGVKYHTARDLRTLGPGSEGRHDMLCIDGLDETRAGSSDGRTPFDEIRARLQQLGRPRFRLSCREADWFGANDRERLEAVAPNGDVLVLRLDPLSDQGVHDILDKNLGVEDPQGFVEAARERGVDGLLRNPLNLEMLAAAVGDEEWPRTKTETFDLACRKLVSEENPEHQIAWSGAADTTALLDAAGDLCAVLLLAGKAGVTLPGTAPNPDHPRLAHLPRVDQQLLPRVLDTDLFALAAEGRLVPAHRQLAEFLAARRIADLIDNGLPVRRLLSLMTGFDGGIISEFRGLAAWLAAQSKAARPEVIERDPLGTVLHGDVQDFSTPEKRLVLQALKAETDRNPWVVGETLLASRLGSLAGSDLVDDFRQALTDPPRDEAHRSFVLLILRAVRAGAPMSGLARPLMTIVRDETWPTSVRNTALEAYIRARKGDPRAAAVLRTLLDDVYSGAVATQNDDLLGTLLTELYPDDLPVADLVGYLRQPARRNLWTRYGVFWTDHVRAKSTIDQMAQLLQLLKGPMERVRSKSGGAPRNVALVVRPPVMLLRHLLEHSPESVAQELLVHWLDFAGWLEFGNGSVVGDAEFFRTWLGENPDVQKAIIEDGVARCRDDRHFFTCMGYVKRSLFGATPPKEYGAWCAERAIAASTAEVADWFVWEAAEFVHNRQGHETGCGADVAGKLRVDVRLTQRFEGRLAALADQSRFDEKTKKTRQANQSPNDGRFDNLRGWVKANAAALHGNECRPDLLHELATAYLNGFSDVRGETPDERLRYLLGADDDLLGAAMAGLRGTTHRSDLPTWTEISKLAAENRTHYLAHPFMVGLEELSRATETADFHLSDAQTRLAVAIHFTVVRWRRQDSSEGPPLWLRNCLVREPDTVGEVWARCAGAQLRSGAKSLEGVGGLAHEPAYADLARAATVPLLRAFPIRCGAGQLWIVRSLLKAAVSHGRGTQLLELIEAKVGYRSMNASQRVYWLTAGLFVRPETYGDRLEAYVAGKSRRIQRLVEMLPRAVTDSWDSTVLQRLIRLLGPYSEAPPTAGHTYSVTWPIQANYRLHSLIERLAADTSAAASHALESLARDDRLVNWRSQLLDRLHRPKGLHREAVYAHPPLEQVAEVLDNRRPANAADLWALTVDLLQQSSRRIRDGATSDWRQYWNVDQYNRAETAKPEDACRDALLSDLEQALAPLEVEATPEGRYANDKRSDIRLSVPGFNVPIEIKRSCHPNWYSAIRTQLIPKYTRDPGTDGYGIYLVFWFGEAEGCKPKPASGRRPKSPEEVRKALLDSLGDQERRKIWVCVIDVSKPDG